jgi:hypothetical protein
MILLGIGVLSYWGTLRDEEDRARTRSSPAVGESVAAVAGEAVIEVVAILVGIAGDAGVDGASAAWAGAQRRAAVRHWRANR